MIRAGVRGRERAFLATLRNGIYANDRSPYRQLLHRAGVEFGDAAALVHDLGVEGALEKLYEAGVYVTEEELNGRKPISRPGLHLRASGRDFDNPLSSGDLPIRSSGSRGPPRRAYGDLAQLAHEALHLSVFLRASGLGGRSFAQWRPVPPGTAGMNEVLRHVRLGQRLERWFSQSPTTLGPGAYRHAAFTAATVLATRLLGTPIPRPEYVPPDRADTIARWLAERKDGGRPVYFNTIASGGVRICAAAIDGRLDIAGTTLRLGGEPYTPAKERVVSDAGCRGLCNYSMAEVGTLGVTCLSPSACDDVHVLEDKIAVIQRPLRPGGDGEPVGALLCTSLVPSTSKLMLNTATGDFGVLERRACGCAFGELGLATHLHTIRSYEKLTSEGMRFGRADVLSLIEEVLPARFGGRPSDYQFVERERGPLPEVELVVSPRVGTITDDEVAEAVLRGLATDSGSGMMAGVWREANTLRVIRREPYTTSSAKVLPLHVLSERASARTS
jgi:hypothetical protein